MVHGQRRIAAAISALACGLAFAACSDDDSSGTGAITGAPELTIERVVAAGHAPVTASDGACVARGRDAARSLAVVVGKTDAVGQLVNWTLAGPLGCYGAAQCGYIHVSLESDAGTVEASTAGTTITLSLASLGDVTGSATITAELLDDQGTAAPFPKATVRVDLEPSCGDEPPPIADAGTPDSSLPDGGSLPDAAPITPDATTPDAVAPDAPVVVPDGATPDAAGPVADAATDPDASP
jgi:hypothetical protein